MSTLCPKFANNSKKVKATASNLACRYVQTVSMKLDKDKYNAFKLLFRKNALCRDHMRS